MTSRCTDAEAAQIAGYGLDAFRRVWKQLVKAGMPAPTYQFKRDGTPSKWRSWDRVALARWAEMRRDGRFAEVSRPPAYYSPGEKLRRRLLRVEKKAVANG